MDVLLNDRDPEMDDVLEAAAKLQQLAPDAVLVGGSAAAFFAHHRISFDHDHDHVLTDLRDRFDVVLEALESEGEWVTNRVSYGKIILGQDIEAGVRQLIRRTPLEIAEYTLPSGASLRVPTIEETLRVKAFLAIKRNQTRDYLDIAALAETMGYEPAGQVLANMDGYYADQRGRDDGVASQVARQLSDPRPVDRSVTRQLGHYKGLAARWHQWSDVVHACQRLSDLMLEGEPL